MNANKISPRDVANAWSPAIYEMIVDIERRIQEALRLPDWMLGLPISYQEAEGNSRYHATAYLRQHREALVKMLIEPAQYFVDPMPYCEAIWDRLDAAREAQRAKETDV